MGTPNSNKDVCSTGSLWTRVDQERVNHSGRRFRVIKPKRLVGSIGSPISRRTDALPRGIENVGIGMLYVLKLDSHSIKNIKGRSFPHGR